MTKRLLLLGTILFSGIFGFLFAKNAFAQSEEYESRFRDRDCKCGCGCFCPTNKDELRMKFKEDKKMMGEDFEKKMNEFRG